MYGGLDAATGRYNFEKFSIVFCFYIAEFEGF